VIREVIRPLNAWNTDLCSSVTLLPGSILSGCRIEPNGIAHPGSGLASYIVEPYTVEFHSSGRRYVCPLFRFQPRTQAVVRVDETQVDELELGAIAV
jgi:hypothetical protein